MRRQSNRRNQQADILKARNVELGPQVRELRKRFSENNKELELAKAQLAMQAFSEPSQSVPLIRRERPLPKAKGQSTF